MPRSLSFPFAGSAAQAMSPSNLQRSIDHAPDPSIRLPGPPEPRWFPQLVDSESPGQRSAASDNPAFPRDKNGSALLSAPPRAIGVASESQVGGPAVTVGSPIAQSCSTVQFASWQPAP